MFILKKIVELLKRLLMTLNSSGPISLGGTTAGQSIAVENGGTGTTVISLNDTAVRSLAGVASGVIVMPTNFYGKSNLQPTTIGIYWGGELACYTGASNKTTRINVCGAQVGSEVAIGTARCGNAGSQVGAIAIFYAGGTSSLSYTSLATRINKCGAQVGTETSVGTAQSDKAGALSRDGSWAPQNFCERYGPSRWMPKI